ncbi:MAG TPA: T9SS type A sorting domain-containing protein [Bacteroidales bacterium]|nr:T9SS type A sorting domain-containing protein [Bacteroidales bacterium]
MRHKTKLQVERSKLKVLGVATLLTFTFSLFTVSAQESINASGGNASGSGGSVSFSVGQVVYQTHFSTSGSVTQGVQQPYEISVVTAIEEAKGINLSVSAYPNPATDYLILEVKDFGLSDLYFYLYDMSGILLQNQKISGSQTSIVMSNLVPATYFVKVVQDNKEVKTFKIIKN